MYCWLVVLTIMFAVCMKPVEWIWQWTIDFLILLCPLHQMKMITVWKSMKPQSFLIILPPGGQWHSIYLSTAHTPMDLHTNLGFSPSWNNSSAIQRSKGCNLVSVLKRIWLKEREMFSTQVFISAAITTTDLTILQVWLWLLLLLM